MKPSFTLGIEEEYQTVDPDTRDLRSHIHAEIIAKGKLLLQERVKSEMHQSVVEVGTSVCRNIKEARDELRKLRRELLPKPGHCRSTSSGDISFLLWFSNECRNRNGQIIGQFHRAGKVAYQGGGACF